MGELAGFALYDKLEAAGFTDSQARALAQALDSEAQARQAGLQEQARIQKQELEEQARVQRQELEEQARVQKQELEELDKDWDEKRRRDLSTKGDLRETELRLIKEIETVKLVAKADLRETELRLLKEIEVVRKDMEVGLASVRKDMGKLKYDLLLWQLGVGITICLIMAKGFGWLGF